MEYLPDSLRFSCDVKLVAGGVHHSELPDARGVFSLKNGQGEGVWFLFQF